MKSQLALTREFGFRLGTLALTLGIAFIVAMMLATELDSTYESIFFSSSIVILWFVELLILWRPIVKGKKQMTLSMLNEVGLRVLVFTSPGLIIFKYIGLEALLGFSYVYIFTGVLMSYATKYGKASQNKAKRQAKFNEPQ